MDELKIWFTIVNLSYSIKSKLLYELKNVENIFKAGIENEKSIFINEKIKEILKKSWNRDKINLIKEKLIKENIKMVTKLDDLYPKRLKVYEDSPYSLFYKGDISKVNGKNNVSIVGSRKCTSYGINTANIICDELCKNGVNIISGMAIGIDSIAHIKSIENNSYTCAVLGSGLDVIYPKKNLSLYYKIIDSGCVISEFLPGTKPYYYNFPRRNKIISGLSDLVIVIEAGEKSGSLITSTSALDQGKDVIAVPGSVFSSQSKGTNKLIKDGAYIFTSIDDIFQLLNIEKIDLNTKNKNIMNKIEKIIYGFIKDTPVHIDEIFRRTNIDIKRLYEVLFELQLKNEIMCLSGNYYVRNNKVI